LTSIIADACIEGHNEREAKLRAEEELETKEETVEETIEEEIKPTEEHKEESPVVVVTKRAKTAKSAELSDLEENPVEP
jgi:hypothetical protein